MVSTEKINCLTIQLLGISDCLLKDSKVLKLKYYKRQAVGIITWKLKAILKLKDLAAIIG